MKISQTMHDAFLAAQEAKTVYWRALSDLEGSVGFEVDATRDLNDLDLENLIKAGSPPLQSD